MTVESFDFRKPGRLPDFVNVVVAEWQERLARELSSSWERQFGSSVEIEVKPIDLCRGEEAVKRFSEDALAINVELREGVTSVVCLSRATALRFASGLLGEEPESEQEDRELTEMELSLTKLLFDEFAKAVDESQPEQVGIKSSTGSIQFWKEYIWSIDAEDDAVVVALEITSPFAGHTVEWIISAAAIEEFALQVTAEDTEVKQGSEMEHLVKTLPIEVTVRLGSRQLEMRELAKLAPGDVLVLDQRIDQPLVALVDGVPKYTGWPGKSGPRRAFQVST